MLEKLRQLVHPAARNRTAPPNGSQVVIFAPRSSAIENTLFSWVAEIKGAVTSEQSLLDQLSSNETKALFFYGEPPKIGNVDFLSDEVLPLLTNKVIYQFAGQSSDLLPRLVTSYIGTGYLGYKEPYVMSFGTKVEEDLFRGVALAGITSILRGEKLSTTYDSIKKKSIELSQFARRAKLDNAFLLMLWLQNNLDSLFLWGDPNSHIPKYSKVVLVSSHLGPPPKKRVEIVDVTPVALNWLREDPRRLEKMSPDEFEDFVANRFRAMKYTVTKFSHTYARDGGIDLIACPEVGPFPFLIAIQIKHHKKGKPVGPSVIREFRDVIEHQGIDIGVIVTNTRFTATAAWVAQQIPRIVRLRDFQALRNWLYDQFDNEDVWKEIPKSLQLAPDLTVTIPNVLRRDHESK